MVEAENMAEYVKGVVKELWKESIPKLNADLAGKRGMEEKKSFLKCLDELFSQCNRMQKADEKDSAKYLYIFYLGSAFLTEKYEIQMNIFSEKGYMDQDECEAQWVPSLFIEYFLSDFEKLDRKAGREVYHYNYAMQKNLRKRLYLAYQAFWQQFITATIGEIEKMESFQNMQKDDDFQIVTSGYMSKGLKIWPLDEEQLNEILFD